MFNPQQYIERLEIAEVDLLIRMLTRPAPEEERCLRAYLGNALYSRLRSLIVSRRLHEQPRTHKQGHVVIVPDFGSVALSSIDPQGQQEQLWYNIPRMIQGDLMLLRLMPDGRSNAASGYEIRATGLMKQEYAELLLSLADRWQVHAFHYDWRKDLRAAAAELTIRVNSWTGAGETVHFVAHGTGGLVVRAALLQDETLLRNQGRLIMLGTPHHGSYLTVQRLAGVADGVRWLAELDQRHTLDDYLDALATLPSLYQLLPSPLRNPELEPLYHIDTYGEHISLLQQHLEAAQAFHRDLAAVPHADRMVNLLGSGQPTLVDLDLTRWQAQRFGSDTVAENGFTFGLEGDGDIPHALGQLDNVPTYYVIGSGLTLPQQPTLLSALDDLLMRGETELLATNPPVLRDEANHPSPETLHQRIDQLRRNTHRNLQAARRQLSPERSWRNAEEIDPEGPQIGRLLTRALRFVTAVEQTEPALGAPFAPAKVTIHLVQGDLAAVDQLLDDEKFAAAPPVDALAVGHYQGEIPRAAMLALDRALTAHFLLREQNGAPDETRALPRQPGLLARYVRRGIIQSRLAQPFFLPDPRANHVTRTIAIVGQGMPGHFGMPELKVSVRELCWSLGQMGKKHLATVLFGVGRNNLRVDEAVTGWMSGIKHALTGVDPEQRLQTITIVEWDLSMVIAIDAALHAEIKRLDSIDRLTVDYRAWSQKEKQALREQQLRLLQQQAERQLALLQRQAEEDKQEEAPAKRFDVEEDHQQQRVVRISATIEGNLYRFGALTPHASIPEREIVLDPLLVQQANDEIVAQQSLRHQQELGQLLEKLLIPNDLRPAFAGNYPLVMMVDTDTARIHWELLAQSQFNLDAADQAAFLGVSRGLTRQLRTTFAPPPEPPPPPRRVVRVLVVADPAADARLPGAEEEGILVANLFEQFNTVWAHEENHIEVVKLLGPQEATRIRVLRELMMRSYDVLHFAGHCVFVQKNPAASGWIFSNGECLSAHELRRIDRVPKFIFSNACESGVTPGRLAHRSVQLAPSFAESFFERGVSNFVCTAWPVNDLAAREFALTLYAALLGMEEQKESGSMRDRWKAIRPVWMYEAMRSARRAIANDVHGIQTWGAYQHYGNPYFQFFDPDRMDPGRD